MTEAKNNKALFHYVLALGDDSLVLGQRLAEWCRNGPFLEEDLALSNVALDYIGRARLFYGYAAELEGEGRSEDDLAFLRDCREFRNFLITELPRGDFAFTTVRQLFLDVFFRDFLEGLLESSDTMLADIAAKAIKETRYHLRRSHDWALRLGDGTEESHARMQAAVDELWGYTCELFEMDEAEQQLVQAGIAVDRARLRDRWFNTVTGILDEATLTKPRDDWSIGGGRGGIHTEHLGYLLAEMQFMQRAYPGLQW
ncbi:MAG: 1,2-phenylacetyl-CoA epoxidase subunit PaaC [Gammaproteobacteria bacterium]